MASSHITITSSTNDLESRIICNKHSQKHIVPSIRRFLEIHTLQTSTAPDFNCYPGCLLVERDTALALCLYAAKRPNCVKVVGNYGTTICKSEDSIVGDFESIPLIDVSGIFSENLDDRKKVAAELRLACVNVGFFYVKNHGISQEMVDGVFEWGKKFFDLTFEEKMEIYIDNVPNYRGYTPLHGAGIAGADGRGSLLLNFPTQNLELTLKY